MLVSFCRFILLFTEIVKPDDLSELTTEAHTNSLDGAKESS